MFLTGNIPQLREEKRNLLRSKYYVSAIIGKDSMDVRFELQFH